MIWRRVPGGRAAHIFKRGEDVPVCGVVPLRKDGTPSPWLPYHARRERVHRNCYRLCPLYPRLNRPMTQEEIDNERL